MKNEYVDIAMKKVPRKKLFSFVESAMDMCGNNNEKPWQIWSYVHMNPRRCGYCVSDDRWYAMWFLTIDEL
jgi:hypothetical protein